MASRKISAAQVADEIRRRLPRVGDVKLQKLLYKCQGHHLAWYDEEMFSDSICAWDMGPVVPSVYHAGKTPQPPDIGEWLPMEERVLNTIGYVISRYGHMSGTALMNLTHSESPWLRANAHRPMRRSARIKTEWIREYHLALDLVEREDEPQFDSAEVHAFLAAAAAAPASTPGAVDSLEDIRDWARRG